MRPALPRPVWLARSVVTAGRTVLLVWLPVPVCSPAAVWPAPVQWMVWQATVWRQAPLFHRESPCSGLCRGHRLRRCCRFPGSCSAVFQQIADLSGFVITDRAAVALGCDRELLSRIQHVLVLRPRSLDSSYPDFAAAGHSVGISSGRARSATVAARIAGPMFSLPQRYTSRPNRSCSTVITASGT